MKSLTAEVRYEYSPETKSLMAENNRLAQKPWDVMVEKSSATIRMPEVFKERESGLQKGDVSILMTETSKRLDSPATAAAEKAFMDDAKNLREEVVTKVSYKSLQAAERVVAEFPGHRILVVKDRNGKQGIWETPTK